MRSWVYGILGAILIHLVILLFGGVVFLGRSDEEAATTVSDVEIVATEDEDAKKKAEEAELDKRKAEEVEAPPEKPPDMQQLVEIEAEPAPLVDAAPRLDALSLSALESMLDPGAAVGELGGAFTLASGGRIGGTGSGSAQDDAAEDLIFSLSELDQRPRPLFQGPPTYPFELRRQKVEGTVHVLFVVDASGRVLDPTIEGATHDAFKAPALEAVRRWKFEPAVRRGEKVPAKIRMPIRFSLNG